MTEAEMRKLIESVRDSAPAAAKPPVAKVPVQFGLLASIPVVTIVTWLWLGAGYARDVDTSKENIKSLQLECAKIQSVNNSQEVVLKELRVMFEMTAGDIKEIKRMVNKYDN